MKKTLTAQTPNAQTQAHETAAQVDTNAAAFAAFPKISWEGHCMYCGHCAPCPVGIDVAQVNKFADLAQAQVDKGNPVPELMRDHYLALEHHADECIACGGCESRCPFGVNVIERMARTAEMFA